MSVDMDTAGVKGTRAAAKGAKPMPLETRSAVDDHVVSVRIRGTLDGAAADKLHRLLIGLRPTDGFVLIDVSGLSSIDAAGWRELSNAGRSCRSVGSQVVLLGAGRRLRNVITRVDAEGPPALHIAPRLDAG